MRVRRWSFPATMLMAVLLVLAGCSGDSSTGSDGDGISEGAGDYLIEAYFGNALVSGGSFSAYVGRLEGSDRSAKECTIDVNGTSIPLLGAASTDDDAVFVKADFGYQADSSYTVTAALGGETATCTFVAPVYTWVEITAPADDSGYTAGESVTVQWQYESGTPENVYVEAWPENSESDVALYDAELGGSTTSHTIPGSATAGWAEYGNILITVDLGEKGWPFTGDLAALGSFVVTVLPGDAIMLMADGGEDQDEWSVSVSLSDFSLEADGMSTIQVWTSVQNQWGSPCPDNTSVTFSVDPVGSATLDPTTVTTSGGAATTTLTAGTTAGTVQIQASALGASGEAELTLTAPTVIEVGTGSHPSISWTPSDPMFGLIVREDGLSVGNLRWTISTSGLDGFTPPVTYGTVPANALQIYPLSGEAEALVTGTQYTVGLVSAVGDTTFHSFTP